MQFGVYDRGVIFDHRMNEAYIFGTDPDGLVEELKTACRDAPQGEPLRGKAVRPITVREEFESMVLRAKEYIAAGEAIQVVGDGAYDSIRLIRHLERRGIEPIIRPRRNARTDRGPPSRRSAARMIRDYGYRAWSRIVGHGGRWMAETAVSRFKALFGEHLLSRKPRWMDSELTIKALIHNMLLSAVTT
jgi:hypothetical protein